MRSQNYWYINQNTSSLQSCIPLCNKPQYYSMYFEMCRQTTVCYLSNYFKNLITMHYLKRQGKIWYVWLLSNNGYSTLMPRVFNVFLTRYRLYLEYRFSQRFRTSGWQGWFKVLLIALDLFSNIGWTNCMSTFTSPTILCLSDILLTLSKDRSKISPKSGISIWWTKNATQNKSRYELINFYPNTTTAWFEFMCPRNLIYFRLL